MDNSESKYIILSKDTLKKILMLYKLLEEINSETGGVFKQLTDTLNDICGNFTITREEKERAEKILRAEGKIK